MMKKKEVEMEKGKETVEEKEAKKKNLNKEMKK